MDRNRFGGYGVAMLIAGLLAFTFLSAFFHISDVDVGFHIRTGEQILASHSIPATNTFSHTCPDQPWLLHQWWPGVAFALLFSVFGITGIIVFKALLATAIMGSAFLTATREAKGRIAIPLWVTTIGISVACVRFYPRPYLFSALFFALLILLDRTWSEQKRWQWIGVPLLMAVWSNTHAGVMYGFIYLCLQAGVAFLNGVVIPRGEQRRSLSPTIIRTVSLAASLGLSALALQLVNPHGIKVLLLPAIYFRDPFWQSLIVEFRGLAWSTDWRIICAMAALLLLQLLSLKQTQFALAVPVWVLALMTIRSQRCVLFFVIAAVPYASHMATVLLQRWRGRWCAASHVLLVVVWIAMTTFVFVPNPTYHFGIGVYERLHPLHIYKFIRKEVAPQRLFNDMRYGAGMLWWLYPDFRPFIDGRCEAYPKTFWRDVYCRVAAGEPEWHEIFDTYGITGALIHIGRECDPRLPQELHASPDWVLVAFDDDAALFLKRTDSNAATIAAHAYQLLWPGSGIFEWQNELADAALGEARRALALYPANVYAGLVQARALLVAGKYEEAAVAYRSLLALPHMQFGPAVSRDYSYALSRITATPHTEASGR